MKRTRHWRQRWDPDAEFMFLRRLRMGDGRNFVFPGDPVTDEIRQRLGRHRLRLWWDAGIIGLANFDLQDPRTPIQRDRDDWRSKRYNSRDLPNEDSSVATIEQKDTITVLPLKGGWYEVVFEGIARRVQGKKALAAFKEQVREYFSLREDGLTTDEALAVVWPE